jgi:hypothetical protein
VKNTKVEDFEERPLDFNFTSEILRWNSIEKIFFSEKEKVVE